MTQTEDKHIEFLIDRGTQLSDQIKELTEEFKGIKVELECLPKGKHKTRNNSQVTISESIKYTDVDPATVKTELRAKRLGKFFMSCVKVNVTTLKKYFSTEELNAVREEKGITRRYSFK